MTLNQTLSLLDLANGDEATVITIAGGCGFVGRMAALGFTPGATVGIVRSGRYGPMIVKVLDTQIALGRGQAERVFVKRATPNGRSG